MVALDEAANIAPLGELPQIASGPPLARISAFVLLVTQAQAAIENVRLRARLGVHRRQVSSRPQAAGRR